MKKRKKTTTAAEVRREKRTMVQTRKERTVRKTRPVSRPTTSTRTSCGLLSPARNPRAIRRLVV